MLSLTGKKKFQPDMLTGVYCFDVKYKNIFSLKRDIRKGGLLILWLQMHFDSFSFEAHVSHLH